MTGRRPKSLRALPPADVAVTMGCMGGCPAVPCAHHEDWGLADPAGQRDAVMTAALRTIEARVRDLAERIDQGEI